MWNWPVVKYKHQNKATNMCSLLFVFDLDVECKFIKNKPSGPIVLKEI